MWNKIIITSVILFFLGGTISAQAIIAGRIADSALTPVNRATINLIRHRDAQLVQSVVSDSMGHFKIKCIDTGKFYVDIRFVGYDPVQSIPFETYSKQAELDLGLFKIETAHSILGNVIVRSREKAIEQKDGKFIYNIKNDIIGAGSSVLEVLEKIPGISVNRQNGSISITGKDGAIVMLDGKRNYMPVQALIQQLSGISGGNVDKIEVITNPSSSYDAEGNAGFINIVLKSNSSEGIAGNIELQAGYGNGSVYSVNGDINYLKGPLNIYAGYSFYRMTQDQLSFNFRESDFGNGKFTSNTNSLRYPIQQNHNARFGIDYKMNRKTTIGAKFTFYNNRWAMDAFNSTSILRNGSNGEYLGIDNHEINQWQHFGANMNVVHHFNNQQALTFNFDYLQYTDDNPTKYKTDIYDNQYNFVKTQISQSSKYTPIHILVGKLDYTVLSTQKAGVQVGAKVAFSTFKNDVSISAISNGNWVIDSNLSSKSTFDERIAAAYVESNYKFNEKASFKAGIRLENTDFYLRFDDGKYSPLKNQYTNWFPSVIFNYKFDQRASASISYSKRINRPAFNDIAPFALFIDPYTFFSGNTSIQPSITHSIGLSFNYRSLLTFLSYSYENNALAKFQISVDSSSNVEVIRPENLEAIKTISSGFTIPIRITEWWTFQASVSGFWKQARTGQFHNHATVEQWSSQLGGSQVFKLPRKIQMELSGFYNSTTLSGTSFTQPVGGLSFGIQKSFDRSSIRFNINDIFNSSVKYTSLVSTSNYSIRNGFDFSQRIFKLSYTYSFGKKGKQGVARNSMTADDERKRVE